MTKANNQNTLNSTTISIINDMNRDPGECIFTREILKFNASVTGLSMKVDKYKLLLKKLQEIYKLNVELYDFTKTNKVFHWREKSDRFRIVGSFTKDNIVFDIFSETPELNQFLFSICKEFNDTSAAVDIVITTTTISPQGLSEKYQILNKETLEHIDYEFYPYIDVEELFSQFSRYNEDILCLLGKTGLGKTALVSSYMKYMLQNADNFVNEEEDAINILYVKSEDVLSSDAFWSNLEPNYYKLIVLDDLDYFLGNRNVVETGEDLQKIKFISNLLSYTDGIHESSTKIIITTNREVKDIDDAILRKGRMFDVLELRPLTNEEALYLWKKNDLPEDVFYNMFNNSDVLAADLGSEIQKMKTDNKTVRPDYLKEDNISILNNYKPKRKLGF